MQRQWDSIASTDPAAPPVVRPAHVIVVGNERGGKIPMPERIHIQRANELGDVFAQR